MHMKLRILSLISRRFANSLLTWGIPLPEPSESLSWGDISPFGYTGLCIAPLNLDIEGVVPGLFSCLCFLLWPLSSPRSGRLWTQDITLFRNGAIASGGLLLWSQVGRAAGIMLTSTMPAWIRWKRPFSSRWRQISPLTTLMSSRRGCTPTMWRMRRSLRLLAEICL